MKNLKNLNSKLILSLLLLISLVLMNCNNDDDISQPKAQWEMEVEALKTATQPYLDFDTATSAGYNVDVTGYRTQMGHHFLNADLLDNTFEIDKPEVLLFVPDENDVMQFVAVEYGIPIEDINNPPAAPEGFYGNNDVWEINTEFNLWTLHVWIHLENPNGIFTALNPVLP